jgi:hypothetical protein
VSQLNEIDPTRETLAAVVDALEDRAVTSRGRRSFDPAPHLPPPRVIDRPLQSTWCGQLGRQHRPWIEGIRAGRDRQRTRDRRTRNEGGAIAVDAAGAPPPAAFASPHSVECPADPRAGAVHPVVADDHQVRIPVALEVRNHRTQPPDFGKDFVPGPDRPWHGWRVGTPLVDLTAAPVPTRVAHELLFPVEQSRLHHFEARRRGQFGESRFVEHEPTREVQHPLQVLRRVLVVADGNDARARTKPPESVDLHPEVTPERARQNDFDRTVSRARRRDG